MSDSVVPDRGATGRGLKRIAMMTGAYGTRNFTVKDIIDGKGRRRFIQTLPFSVEEAEAAAEAGIDMMKVRFDPLAPGFATDVRRVAPHTFLSFSMSLTTVASEAEALRAAYAAMEIGADSIMCQWSPRFMAAVAENDVPIEGHAGLVPRKSTWTGGLRAVGKTLDEAMWVYRRIKAFEEAGAWAVEIEVIPHQLMTELSTRTSLVTVSIGSGPGGDVQFLFAQDILGDGAPPFPRHSKQYADLYAMRNEMQAARVDAFKAYIDEVSSGAFPGPQHLVNLDDVVLRSFREQVDDEPFDDEPFDDEG
ncbi:MAG: 3-methyl-2-oxobutanoate hydroxymethyltransferase [Acidimicrobiia bacterium]|nr:3-methyl-2-oxobutanoate hydroxymethyltransferase [Acidimicrobiia bacterium]